MNEAITIDLKEIERPSPRTADPSKLRRYARKLDRATSKIETQWDDLSPEQREAYMRFAYAAIEFPDKRRNKIRHVLDRYRSAWYSFRITLKGEQEAFAEYDVALRRFIEAILDAVERENLEYQETLTEVLEEGLSAEVGRAMTVEEARERRRQLRDQAFE